MGNLHFYNRGYERLLLAQLCPLQLTAPTSPSVLPLQIQWQSSGPSVLQFVRGCPEKNKSRGSWSLEEGRRQIYRERKSLSGADDAPPMGACVWGQRVRGCWVSPDCHCHGQLVLLTVCCCCATATSGGLSPVHVWESRINRTVSKTRTNSPGHSSSKLPSCTPIILDCMSQVSAALYLFHRFQLSYKYQSSITALKRTNYSHSWDNVIPNSVRQLILLKNLALYQVFITDGYLRRHTL